MSLFLGTKMIVKSVNLEKLIVAGIDAGSSTTKAVLLDKERNILSKGVISTGGRFVAAAGRCFEIALNAADIKPEAVTYGVSTGYGRKRVPFFSEEVTEITCHTRGVHFLFPKTKTIIDVGGQDSKAISISETGKVLNFVMNDKCAAGTGRFLEVMARVLEVDLDDMGKLHQEARQEVAVSSFCTVFAESEVISLIAEGNEVSDIVRGINSSIASKIIGLMKRVSEEDEICFTGGVAKNQGVAVQIKEQLYKNKITIPEDPQITGALGAALIALERCLG